jgi:hypothetical protein
MMLNLEEELRTKSKLSGYFFFLRFLRVLTPTVLTHSKGSGKKVFTISLKFCWNQISRALYWDSVFFIKKVSKSIGSGNTIVEFFSEEMVFKV